MSYSNLVSAKSPIIYWKLNEASGAPANSGSLGGSATIGTDVTRSQDGIPGNGTDKAIRFGSGTGNAYVRQNVAASYLNSSYTVETWFKTSKTDATIWVYFAAPYAYLNTTAAGHLQFVPIDAAGSIVSSVAVNDGNWHHAVCVYVPGGTSRLYLDGTQVGTTTVSHSTFSTSAYIQGSDHRAFSLNGTLDEFAMYPSVLTAEQVQQHYLTGMNLSANASHTATPATGAGMAPDATVDLSAIKPLFTDTFTGTAGSPWSANWSTYNTPTYGYINLDGAGKGRLGYTNIGTAAGAWATSVQQGQDVGLVYTFTTGGAGNWFGFVNGPVTQIANGTIVPTNSLVLYPSSNLTYLEVRVGGTKTADVNTGLGNLSGKRVRMLVKGNSLKVKTWAVGAQEPDTWGYEATVSDLDVEWKAFFSVSNMKAGSTGVAYVDDVEMYQIVNAYANVNITETPALGSGVILETSLGYDKEVAVAPFVASGLITEATYQQGKTIAATPATGSGMMQEARIPLSAITSVSADVSSIGSGTDETAYVGYDTPAFFKFSLPTNVEITSVTLWVTKAWGSSAGTFEAQRITSAWDESGTPAPSIDSTVIGSAPFPGSNPSLVGIRITDVAAWNDGAPQHGVAIYGKGMPYGSGAVVATREAEESSHRPYVTYEYVPLSAIKVRPTPAEGTGLMQYREVFTGTPEIYNSWIDMNARRSDTPGSEYTHSWLPKIQITSNGAGLVVEASQLQKTQWDFPFNANLGTAKLLLRMHRPSNWDPAPPGATTRMTVRLVTTPWDWDDTSSITAETIGPVISVQDILVEGEEYRELDVTDAVQMWLTGTPNHGVYVTTSGYSMAYFSLAFEGDPREGEPSLAWQDRTWPRILMEAYETGDINVRTYPIRGSGLMRDGKLPQPNVTVPAEKAQAFATMPGGLFTSPAVVLPNAITGDGVINDVALALDVNGLSEPEPFVATAYAVDPDEARRDEDDPYFRRIVATTDNDDIWFRLDEQSGTKVIQRLGGSGAILPDDFNPQANWNIAPQHGINGPAGRRAVRLDGRQYIDRNVTTTLAFPNPGLSNAGSEFTFETVIRTTQKDSLLYSGSDPRPVGNASYETRLWIKDGKITLWGPTAEVSGFADIADGQWHHIVVSWGFGSSNPLNNGMRIYVDGQLDIRRRDDTNYADRIFITPDHWFGAPVGMRDWLNLPPNFIGDVMEMTYRYRMDLGMHDIQRLYYDAMGIIPIEIAPFRGAGEMPDAKGKGNQKRILMLYFNTSHWYSGTPDTGERSRGIFEYPGDFEFGVGIPTPGSPGYDDAWRTFGVPPQFFASGMRIFFQPIDYQGLDYFRDPVTDLPRLLDLEHDIDVTDFDIIIYKNWPDEGRFELDRIKNIYGTTEILNEHLDSLRRVIDKHGISLWISNPTLAVQMGVISTAEVIPTMIDRAPHPSELAAAGEGLPQYGLNQIGKYEDHGPHVDPWQFDENGESTYPDGMGGWGIGRYDTYRNNRERIVAAVPGMTDALRWRFIEDYQMWSRFNHMSLDLDFQYKLGDRRNKVDQNGNIIEAGGMRLGDEYVSPHLFQSDLSIHSHSITKSEQFRTHTWAAPPGSVMAGTVVTKFGANVWVNGNVQIPNPYADYAGTIIVQPGDALKGKPVGGKILVTLSNDPIYALFGSLDWVGEGDGGFGGEDNFYMQDVPPDAELIERFGDTQGETPWTREWQYSTRRWNVGYDPRGRIAGSNQEVTAYQNADGTVSYRTNNSGQYGGSGVAPLLLSEKYPLIQTKVFSIVKAGIKWLQERVPYVPGQRTVRVLALPGQGEMPKPTVNAGRSVQVVVPDAGLANAQMRTPDGYDEDTVIQVFPFVGSARITNYVRFVVVGPAYGYGNMPTVGDITAAKEGITLFLHRPDSIILYLEEL